MTPTTGSEDQIKQRLKDFDTWLTTFSEQSKYKGKIAAISNAAELLNQHYWKIVNLYIRPLLTTDPIKPEENSHHLINHFKIISIAELTVMSVLPFDIVDDSAGFIDEEVNAKFAWFVALIIFSAWHPDMGGTIISQAYSYREILAAGKDGKEDERAEFDFKKEHIQLLTTLDTSIQLPVLSNAQTWRMFYFCTLALKEQFK